MTARLLRWFGAKAAAPATVESGFPFDAVIDLGPGDTGADDAGPAMAAVRRAVVALPGANWINVGRHDGLGSVKGVWVRVFPPGSGVAPRTPAWDALKRQVAEAAAAALKGLPAPGPQYDLRHLHPRAGGFADQAGFGPVAIRKVSGMASLAPAPAFEPSAAEFASPARERIAAGEAAALDDGELTAALLSLVLPADAAPLAARVIERFGSFAAALSAPVRELQGVPGLGPHSVAALKLVHAAALRASQAGLMHRLVLDDMARLTDYLAAVLARERIEQFRILFLDAASCLIADEAQARGTVNHTPVYPREVVRRAIELRAASLVLVHNHPSGDPTPSREDVEMTATVRDAAALLGITVKDHIIVGNGQWVSLRDAGLM